METYKNDIIATRKGGLGSSDAKMVAKIGRASAVSYADKERLAQMTGQAERRQFTTAATENGDYIEGRLFESMKVIYPNAESNPYYKSEELSAKFGFDVFCHIDIESVTDTDIYWVECKASKKCTKDVLDTYMHQLEWEMMLLEEKAAELNKTPHLILAHYLVTELGEFNPEQLTTMEIEASTYLRNDILLGLQFIANFLPDFKWEPKEELTASDLPVSQQNALAKWLARQQQMKLWEEEDKQIKDGLFEMMSAMGVKSIRTEGAIFTVKEGYTSSKLDSKKVQKLHPDVYEECLSQSQVKSSLLVKLTNIKPQ